MTGVTAESSEKSAPLEKSPPLTVYAVLP